MVFMSCDGCVCIFLLLLLYDSRGVYYSTVGSIIIPYIQYNEYVVLHTKREKIDDRTYSTSYIEDFEVVSFFF
jgi:hypothetical protein